MIVEEQPVAWSEGLNDSQADAVKHIEGPLLVLAGAGTGKTKVLTTRIVNLLNQGVFPSQILAVTFTNKAAKEMAERIATLAPFRSQGIWLGTFHSIAAKILRRYADTINLSPDFTIIDADDQLRLVKNIYKEGIKLANGHLYQIDEKRWPAKQMVYHISRWKDNALAPEDLTAKDDVHFADGHARDIYRIYQVQLRNLNAVDFGDLLLYNIKLLSHHPAILEQLHQQFHYILVDEYQDTNIAQYLWLRLLAQKRKNICCVGDDDQSIYGWRGAEVGNILRFEKDFPGAKVIRLERNYRSTSHILDAASHLISFNSSRLGKTLWTEGNKGEPISVVAVWDDKEEAQFIANEIHALKQNETIASYTNVAVLVRASFQTRTFEEAFLSNNIPYRVVGGLRFYERMEIRDSIAYLRLIQQKHDGLAFERVVNTPKRGIGATTMQLIRSTANDNGVSYMDAVTYLLENKKFSAKIGATLKGFLDKLNHWVSLAAALPLPKLAETILNESGYIGMWKQQSTLESQSRLDNIKELLHALEEFESLQEFLEYVSLVNDIDEKNQDNMISIMTLHGAKGLEFNTVFLPGWEDGLFPNQRALEESGTKGLEEERRLAYVGITRAKQRLYITYAANRRMYGQFQSNIPSRFLDELPDDNIAKESRVNSFFGYSGGGTSYKQQGQQNTEISKQEASGPQVKSAKGFMVGDAVAHIKFGTGTVISINGDQLEILFTQIGKKKIIDSFVKKA